MALVLVVAVDQVMALGSALVLVVAMDQVMVLAVGGD